MRRFLSLAAFAALASSPASGLELSHSPSTDEVVSSPRPTITVYLPMGQSLHPQDAHLWVNGHDVTGQCQRNAAYISYRPLAELSGSQTVHFMLGSFDQTWSFRVKKLVPISAVKINAPRSPSEFDEIGVELDGPPHEKAWFQVDEIPGKTPMHEETPGVYVGTFEIPANFTSMRAQVTGYLTEGPAVQELKARPLSLLTSGFRVKILDPEPDSDIPDDLVLHGRTRPGCDVFITPRIGFKDGIEHTSDSQPIPRFQTMRIVPDEKGFFEMKLPRPARLPDMELILLVSAKDVDGHESAQQIFQFHYANKDPSYKLPSPETK